MSTLNRALVIPIMTATHILKANKQLQLRLRSVSSGWFRLALPSVCRATWRVIHPLLRRIAVTITIAITMIKNDKRGNNDVSAESSSHVCNNDNSNPCSTLIHSTPGERGTAKLCKPYPGFKIGFRFF